MIFTLTSPIDTNLRTKSALVLGLETKESFVYRVQRKSILQLAIWASCTVHRSKACTGSKVILTNPMMGSFVIRIPKKISLARQASY